jgi:guanylate kinase
MSLGPLIILSGPAGSGKSTVINRLIAESDLPLRRAVSVTTRSPREGEKQDIDYHFRTEEQFRQHLDAKEFLEWAQVHGKDYYGTLRSEVDPYRARGMGVILVIDVQGAAQVRKLYPEAVSVFLVASTWEIYEQRLRNRGTEDEASLARRLATAQQELTRVREQKEYQHEVINDDLGETVRQLRELIAPHFPGTKDEGAPCTTS